MITLTLAVLEDLVKDLNAGGPITWDEVLAGMTGRLVPDYATPNQSLLIRAWCIARISPCVIHMPTRGYYYQNSSMSRLDAGLIVALNQSVHRNADGSYTVTSSQLDNEPYHVNGSDCPCQDSTAAVIAGRKGCKHQWAIWLTRKADELAAQPLPPHVIDHLRPAPAPQANQEQLDAERASIQERNRQYREREREREERDAALPVQVTRNGRMYK